MDRLILHEDPVSGNCYKIRLTAALLDVPIERRAYDIRRGETRTPEFLATINPDGRIPVLQIGDRFLPESNAACLYLADGSPLIPADRLARAEMMRWLFWEQYSHEPNVATLRFWLAQIGEAGLTEAQRAAVPAKRAAGEAALALMARHLERRTFFIGEAPSVADIALFAYTHVAHEAGFVLPPAVAAWCSQVAALPGFVAWSD